MGTQDASPAIRLRVSQIYATIQGESTLTGWPCVILRLAGCPFRCTYCDTPEARDAEAGKEMTLPAVLERVGSFGIDLVAVTGGEPLAQTGTRDLLQALLAGGYRVILESGNAVPIDGVDPRVRLILDIKTPDSGMHERQIWENLAHLRPQDEIKFVLCSRADYEWAREQVRRRDLARRFVVHFSPATSGGERTVSAGEEAARGGISRRALAEWILADRLPVRLNLQLHVWIWGAGTSGH